METPMLNVVTKFWMSKILEKVKDWAIRPGQGWLREGGRTIDSLFQGGRLVTDDGKLSN